MCRGNIDIWYLIFQGSSRADITSGFGVKERLKPWANTKGRSSMLQHAISQRVYALRSPFLTIDTFAPTTRKRSRTINLMCLECCRNWNCDLVAGGWECRIQM